MKLFIFLSILIVVFGASAFQIAAQDSPSDEARKVMMPVVYTVAGMDKVKIIGNLKYTKSNDPNILMDVYQPPDLSKNEKRPAVIFIHYAAKPEYTPKDWGIFTSWGRLIAASGLVGVNFTNRLEYPEKSLENAAQDVSAAISYVRANADKLNVDKDRICLFAFSAGGSMLSLAMRGDTPFIKCVVGFYAFMDIRQSDYRKTETPDALKSFSPITYLERDASRLPPMFVARAGRDEVPGINDSIDRFTKEAISKNVALDFANHPNGVHGFDNQDNDERSREIVRRAIEFVKTHLENNAEKTTNCTLGSNDKEWIEQTLQAWQTVSRDSLHLRRAALPWLILFDENCIWHVNPNLLVFSSKFGAEFNETKINYSGRALDVYGIFHDGKIALPDGNQIPAQLTSFTGTYENGKKAFLVFAMPTIWQKAPHLKTETNLNRLIRSVFVHEMTHTRHRNFYAGLNRIEKKYHFMEGLNDDIVQTRFSGRADFRQAFEAERDLLYRAAAETDFRRKRELATDALASIENRRRRFFTGNDSIYTEVEDIFLTMEGAANWAGYKSAMAEGMNRADALKLIRRSGKYWSQEEGLALFLLVDSLLPNWQTKAFGESMISAMDLLKEAVKGKYKSRRGRK